MPSSTPWPKSGCSRQSAFQNSKTSRGGIPPTNRGQIAPGERFVPKSTPKAATAVSEVISAPLSGEHGSTGAPAFAGLRRVWGVKVFLLSFGFVTVLSLLGMYRVWTQYQVYSLGQDLSRETLQYRSAREENQKLTLELSTLKEARVVRSRAEQRLGMHQPAPQEVVEIRVQSNRVEATP
jgi:cell division protein FtsL